jgi:thiamine kinase-like enzyme
MSGSVDDDPTTAVLAALRTVPPFAAGELRLSVLSGGITNRNYLVTVAGTDDRFVVRVPGKDTGLLGIRRDAEHAATIAAASVAVGPEVVAFIPPDGLLVTRFIDGSPVAVDGMRTATMLGRIADSLRRVHDGPAIPGRFEPLRVVTAYHDLAVTRGVPMPGAYREAIEIGHRIDSALRGAPIALTPCHNDLLNANFIDDGQRIRIVDWEYAAMGDPFFDLGNLSVNHDLTGSDDAVLLAAYDGHRSPHDADPRRLARLTAMRVMSDFREAMWGVLQQGISSLEVDFAAYAAEHFDRLRANASSAAFERALREIGTV